LCGLNRAESRPYDDRAGKVAVSSGETALSDTVRMLPIPTFESALDWNRCHPPGTRVSVRLSDGREVSAETASWAQQWGSFAVLSLARMGGLWTTSALVPTPDLFDAASMRELP
jgi:hypothetical protein